MKRRLVQFLPVVAIAAALMLPACGDTGSAGTTSTQGGAGRAPGAPPPAGQQPPARATPTTGR